MLGEHCISSRSKTQSVIATSTGEAEFYAICSAVSQGLGLRSLLVDLDVKVKVRLGIDASAGKAMALRRGLGKSKHIDVQYLWVQAKVADQEVMLIKIPGEENRSDLMTKYLQAPRQDMLLEARRFRVSRS